MVGKNNTTHLKRNILARVRSDEKEELAADLRHVFMTGVENYTIDDAWQRWQKLCNKWGQYTAIKRMGEDESYRYYLTYLTYHKDIQSMIYTTNWIERLQRTFRRVLRFRTALPNEQSALTLRQNSHGYKMLSAKDTQYQLRPQFVW